MRRIFERLLYEGRVYPIRERTGPIPNPCGYNAHFHCFGLLVNWRAAWVGAHYSKQDKRLCVNLLPFVTIWWAQPGGRCP